MTPFARTLLCAIATGLLAAATPAADPVPPFSPVPASLPPLPDSPVPLAPSDALPLPEPIAAHPTRLPPVRLSLAARQPDPFGRFDAPPVLSSLEVQTPIPNLWVGLTDLALPLRPSTVEDPGGLLDSLTGASPMLRYRLSF